MNKAKEIQTIFCKRAEEMQRHIKTTIRRCRDKEKIWKHGEGDTNTVRKEKKK